MVAIRREAEVKLALDYLHSEPVKEYEENKNKPKPADCRWTSGA